MLPFQLFIFAIFKLCDFTLVMNKIRLYGRSNRQYLLFNLLDFLIPNTTSYRIYVTNKSIKGSKSSILLIAVSFHILSYNC